MSVAVFVNPRAGGGRAAEIWSDLVDHEPRLAAAEILLVDDLEAAITRLDDLDAGVERLIVVGGDGSAHLAVNRLRRAARTDVALGLVPAGTGSDLARTLELPASPRSALELALEAPPRRFDLLVFEPDDGERRWVLNIASVGVSGAVDVAVNAAPKEGGALALRTTYLRKTVSALWRYEPRPCRVAADGRVVWNEGFFVAAIANGRYFGQGMKVAPTADPADGVAELVVVPPVPRWQWPLRLPQFFAGTHIRLDVVEHRRVRTVRVEPPVEGFPPWDLDGETVPPVAATVSVEPSALHFAY